MRSSLFPLRTCFIAFSPFIQPAIKLKSRDSCPCWIILPFCGHMGKEKNEEFQRFSFLFFLFFTLPAHLAWHWAFQLVFGCWRDAVRILDRDGLICCHFISPFFSPFQIRKSDEMDSTASVKWPLLLNRAVWFIYYYFFFNLCRRGWMNGEKQRSAVSDEATSSFFFFFNYYSLIAERRTLWFGWNVFVVMRLPSIPTDITLDFPCRIRTFPEWLDSLKICPPAMEAAQAAEGEADRAPGEGEPGVAVPLRVARGFTSSRWHREHGQWPFTTRTPSNRTASPSTAPSSSSGKTISSGSTPNE